MQLLAAFHPAAAAPREAAKPIRIGHHVGLGGGTVALPGVSVGDDTVAGAGAVVTRDRPAGVVAAGNPARVTRQPGPAEGAR